MSASKSHEEARSGLARFEDDVARLDMIKARVQEINRILDCLAFVMGGGAGVTYGGSDYGALVEKIREVLGM